MDITQTFYKDLPVQYRILVYLIVFLLIITGILLIYGYSDKDRGYPQSDTTRDLSAVGDENFPPFSYLENGEPAGYDVDVMHGIEKLLNRTIHIELVPWSQAIDLVAKGDRDILIGVAFTDERKTLFDFTERTINQRTARFMRKDNFHLPTSSLSHWNGTVAGQKGDMNTQRLKREYPNLTIIEYPDQMQALQAVIDKKADLFIGNYYVGMYTLQALQATDLLKMAGEPESERPYGIAVTKGRSALLSDLNQAIEQLKESGEMKKIRDKWFGENFFSESLVQYLRAILLISGGILLFFGIYVIILRRYNTKLNKKVREQTEELTEKNRRLQESERTLLLHIQELDENRRALAASEERFNLAMQATRDGIWDWQTDPEGYYFSPGYYHMLGYEADEIPFNYEVWLMHLHPDHRQMAASVVSGILSGEHDSFEIEVLMRTKQGEYIWIMSRGMTVSKDPTGKPTRIVGTHVNITNRKKTESELAELKILMDAAFNQSNVAMVLIRLPNETIHLINSAARELFGIDSETIQAGMNFFTRITASLRDPDTGTRIPEPDHPLRKAAEGIVTTGYEAGIADQTGSVRHVLINASPIVNSVGKLIAAIMVCADISENRQIKEAMNRVNRKLNMLASITRNEIQNQGFVLRGYLEICKTVATEPAVIEILDKIQEIVGRLNAHIINTRNFQDMGMNPPTWQNLREIYIFAASHVNLSEIRHVQEIGSYEVFADPFFEKALTNILNNAVIHGGHVSTITACTKERGWDLVLIITDDGCGIEPERKEQIFMHGDPSNQGFGLFFAREVLSITGLMIHETGEAGHGARFEITIPRGMFRPVQERDGPAGN